MTQSNSEKFDKKFCSICQIPTETNLTRAEREDTGKYMLVVSEKLPDKSFFRRLSSIPKADDAVANDVVYHDTCWIKVNREAAPKTVVTENFVVKTLTDIELLNLIELRFSIKPQEVIGMNEINRIYRNILLENGMENKELSENYKKYLKELLKSNLKHLVFVQSTQRNQPDNVMIDKTHVQAVSSFNHNENDMKSLWKISKQILKEILAELWKFDGDFESYKPPHLLFTFLKWVLISPHN